MKEWVVGATEAGMRLDRWLVQRGGMTRGAVKRQIDLGGVRINGRRVVIAKWSMQAGDRVYFAVAAPSNQRRERTAAYQPIEVLFEDADVIAVSKPAGVIVLSPTPTHDTSMVDRVRAYLRRKYPSSRGTYVKALHRLDRETSGVLLLAKSKAGEQLIQQFKHHRVTREYIAIVHGQVEQEQGTINVPLLKGEFGHGRKVVPVQDATKGKAAVTHYGVEERYLIATYLRLRVETGRTHQIRVHLASIGHPLLGDRRYGLPEDPLPVPRQALHATRLAFHHPVTGQKIDLELPPPEDFVQLIDALRDSV